MYKVAVSHPQLTSEEVRSASRLLCMLEMFGVPGAERRICSCMKAVRVLSVGG